MLLGAFLLAVLCEPVLAWSVSHAPTGRAHLPRSCATRLSCVGASGNNNKGESLAAGHAQVPRREMTARAAKLAAAGAAGFSLVRPVLAAKKERKVKPVGWSVCCVCCVLTSLTIRPGTLRSQAIATNREMQEVTATQWLKKHPRPGMRELVVGLEGEPFWLIAEVTRWRGRDEQISQRRFGGRAEEGGREYASASLSGVAHLDMT